MRGGQIHEYIIEQLDRVFQQHGFRTARQVVARSGSRLSFVDLVVEDASGALLCVEVETGGGGGRVWRDLDKARKLGALWIVVPDQRVKESIRRRVRQLGAVKSGSLSVLTYGQAMQQVTNNIPFSSGSIWEENSAK